MAAPPGGSVTSLPLPQPKSPPRYPDLYGKRREMAKVQMLEREISFLEEELKSIQRLQPASKCCKELADFVMSNSDPLMPTNKSKKSCWFWKLLRGMCCFSLSWICCCSCPKCSRHLKCPTCSDCLPCSCNSCSCCCSLPDFSSCLRCCLPDCSSCLSCCNILKWKWSCFSCPPSSCCSNISCRRNCCKCGSPSCMDCCSCCRCKCECSCPKCPNLNPCCCCSCPGTCCNPRLCCSCSRTCCNPRCFLF